MSIKLNNISNSLVQELSDCILKTMQEPQFLNFTMSIDGITAFQNLRKGNGYVNDVPAYLSSLKTQKQLHLLLVEYLENNPFPNTLLDPKVAVFKNKIFAIFTTDADNNYQLKDEIFVNQLLGDKIPFIDRQRFRDLIKAIICNNKKEVVFATGESGSGMSYLGKYLEYLCAVTDMYTFKPIDVSWYLDDVEAEDDLGVELAKILATSLGIEVVLDDDRKDKFKFMSFITSFNQKLEEFEAIPLIFLHDFHKIPISESLNKFMYEFVRNALRMDNHPFHLVIAGFDYGRIHNWYNDLVYSSSVYDIPPINKVDLTNALKCIYDCYRDTINEKSQQPMKEGEYIGGMLEQLNIDNDTITIQEVGRSLRDHLQILNQN